MKFDHGKNPLKLPRGLERVGSFQELEDAGFKAFSLGPIYVYACVEQDIMLHFLETQDPTQAVDPVMSKLVQAGAIQAHDRPRETFGTHMFFDRLIIKHCVQWANILNVMDVVSYEWFKKWMMANTYVSRQHRKYFEPRLYTAPIIDPIAYDARQEIIPSSLDVFSVCSMKWSLAPVTQVEDKSKTPAYIDLREIPPDEEVRKRGLATLGIINEL